MSIEFIGFEVYTQSVPRGTKRERSTAMKKTMMCRMQMYIYYVSQEIQ